MGTMFVAQCSNCGYRTDMLCFGGGMRNFTTYDGEPVYNSETKEIEVANGKERKKIQEENPHIRFYFHNDTLYKKHREYSEDPDEETGEKGFRDKKLYLCPRCNKYTVDFLRQGMWD